MLNCKYHAQGGLDTYNHVFSPVVNDCKYVFLLAILRWYKKIIIIMFTWKVIINLQQNFQLFKPIIFLIAHEFYLSKFPYAFLENGCQMFLKLHHMKLALGLCVWASHISPFMHKIKHLPAKKPKVQSFQFKLSSKNII